MRSSNTRTAYKSGRPVRNDKRGRSTQVNAQGFRADVHIERPVSTSNHDLSDWLATFTRKNRALKDTRNIGGLALTYVEGEVINEAMRKNIVIMVEIRDIQSKYRKNLAKTSRPF